MERITYKQAAEMLGVGYGTIKQAVLRGNLTRVLHREKQAYLLRGQVELFKGKGRISVHALHANEQQQWETYKQQAENPTDSTQFTAEQANSLFDSKLYALKEGMNGLFSNLISPSYMDAKTRGHL